jgi:UDP-N-acetylglucosamine 2-epimerase (non-hydrolysing)/GDP/UDP-N,N'-diacetylbacillosamine 2-epimerase (hydrolysing)
LERPKINTCKIAVLTGTRAEYGILRTLLKKIKAHPKLDLYLIVTGTHLSEEFGFTIGEIEKDGFQVHAKVDTLNREDSGKGMAEYMGNTIIKLAQVFERIKPDVLILIGDRAEMLAGAITSTCMNILVAHIHGGDTSGGVDEGFRNAISKLAHIHFTPTEETKRKLIEIGEDPSRIFVVGTLALESICEELVAPKEIAMKYGIDLTQPVILVVQHSTVTEVDDAPNQIRETLEAVVELGFQTIVAYPNADAGGRKIIRAIHDYEKKYPFIKAYKSLPRSDYLSLMSISTLMIGNSSSGIIEAPSLGIPVINVGHRQKGRMRAVNIIDVNYDKKEILNSVKIVRSDSFKSKLKNIINPWQGENSSETIVKVLLSLNQEDLIQK